MAKNWEQIGAAIAKMSPEARKDDATIYLEEYDEYFAIDSVEVADEDNDILDEGAFFLNVSEVDGDDEDDVSEEFEEVEENEV